MNAFNQYQLRSNTSNDLKLHMRILQKSHKGIYMNLLTYREPTRIYLTDACEICIVDFRSKGRSWRWQIPKEYWGRAHINLLEFCAELVSIWIDIAEDTLDEEEYLLSMGDSTTYIGCINKSRKPDPNEHLQTTLAKMRPQRQLADLLIDNKHLLY